MTNATTEATAGATAAVAGATEARAIRVPAEAGTTRRLLAAGAVAAPLFLGLVGIQLLTREGFDLSRQPLSLLSLGDWGWVQIANFVLTGLLVLTGAVGLRRALRGRRGGTWGVSMIALAGVGLILAGVMVADPSMGWPAGAPEGPAETMSWHAVAHGIGAMLTFGSLSVAAVIFALRFLRLRQRGWAVLSVLPLLALVVVGTWQDQESVSVPMAIGSVAIFGWLSALLIRVRAETGGN